MKRSGEFRRVMAGVVLCTCVSVIATPITRIDVYDKADNNLLFVTFDYNTSGECTGRSVFASDSTFMRSIAIQPGGASAATKEKSIDFAGNPLFTTTINPPSGGKTSFSTTDQFGLSQFGSPLSYSETAANTFDVTQSNNTICKEQYEFDAGGELTRITVLDKSGAAAWYALVTHEITAVRPLSPVAAIRPVRLTTDRGKIRLRFELSAAGFVRAEIFTPAGRKVLSMVHKKLPAGSHRISSDGSILGNGTYVVRMTVNGIATLTRMIAVQR
jgi:hypothetical protein